MEQTKHDIINGEDYKNLIINAAQGLEDNKEEINDLNVFPVPDGDTGSNMSLTVGEAARTLENSDSESLTDTATATAKAMLHGARGNSGVITSLIFRGIAKVLENATVCDGKTLALALTKGAELAYSSVENPADGTILTVVKYSAEVATRVAKENNSFEYVLKCVIDAAETALNETIKQNPVLEKAGVVDAGGMGWLVIIKAMYNGLVSGKTAKYEAKEDKKQRSADFSAYETADITFTFCTEFIIKKHNPDADSAELKSYLSTMGDSLVMIDDGEIIKAHVHTNDPHQVLGKALEYGIYETVKVENMKSQHTSKLVENEPKAQELLPYGIVAVASGEGFSELFKELGANEIVSGGQTMNPSTNDIYEAVCKINAKTIFILPNNKNIVLSANQVQDLTDKKIVVIPTRTLPEGISAMLAFDSSLPPLENYDSMCEIMSTVTTMQITYAAKDSTYDDMQISAGDYLGVSCGTLTTNKDLTQILSAFADKISKLQSQAVSIYYGKDVAEDEAEKALMHLTDLLGDEVEINLYYGGQPVYYYIISAE